MIHLAMDLLDDNHRLREALATIWRTLDHDEWDDDFVAEVDSLLDEEKA